MRRKIGITLGDPAGIGPEITEKALASRLLPGDFDYLKIGIPPKGVIPGKPDAACARAAVEALESSVSALRTGEIDAVVTAPVGKATLRNAGFPFPGQTEFFADRAGTADFAMVLTGGPLTVGLVTIHVPLRDVAGLVSHAEVVRVGNLLAAFARQRGVAHPRIAVAGLNPHAGEEGHIGSEEESIIAPAVADLNARWAGRATFGGPFPPDTIFRQAAAGEWDAVLCMYHDQGLIPLKLIAFDSGVNVTVGLPFIRTSPDHGTAYNIAGQGVARPDSMIAAIRLAAELARGK